MGLGQGEQVIVSILHPVSLWGHVVQLVPVDVLMLPGLQLPYIPVYICLVRTLWQRMLGFGHGVTGGLVVAIRLR